MGMLQRLIDQIWWWNHRRGRKYMLEYWKRGETYPGLEWGPYSWRKAVDARDALMETTKSGYYYMKIREVEDE